jgi:hypothetical protein
VPATWCAYRGRPGGSEGQAEDDGNHADRGIRDW